MFEKIKNVAFLIYNEGTFISKKEKQHHSSFKYTRNLRFYHNYDTLNM